MIVFWYEKWSRTLRGLNTSLNNAVRTKCIQGLLQRRKFTLHQTHVIPSHLGGLRSCLSGPHIFVGSTLMKEEWYKDPMYLISSCSKGLNPCLSGLLKLKFIWKFLHFVYLPKKTYSCFNHIVYIYIFTTTAKRV